MHPTQSNIDLLTTPRRIVVPWRRTALCVAVAALAGLSPGNAAVTVSPDIQYHYSLGRGEGLSCSHDGYRLMVSSPIDISAGTPVEPAETTYSTFIPFISHTSRPHDPFFETHSLALGAIEASDVAVLQGERYGLVAVRANSVVQPQPDPPALPVPPVTPQTGALLAINGTEVLQTLPITGRPDGMKATPDGRYAVVAVERGGEILVYDLTNGAGNIHLAARVTRPVLEAFYPVGGLNPKGTRVEPESVGFSHDSSFALVTIQESSSVAALDMTAVTAGQEEGTLTVEQIGALALKNVVHLPHGFKNSAGAIRGVECDGVGVSPDGSFAIVANETHQTAKHLQGLSVLDLRGGLTSITARTYSIFDIDPTLLNNTGLAAVPVVNPGDPYPADANKLPRLDPANVKIVKRNNETVAAFVIERYNPSSAQLGAAAAGGPPNESRGSVLFLEVSGALDGVFEVIERVPLGVPAPAGNPNGGANLEGVDSAQHGRWIFVSISNGGGDKGTVARLELKNN